jgi:hypothetical protein
MRLVRWAAAVGAVTLAGCATIAPFTATEPPGPGAVRSGTMAFTIPQAWSRVDGTMATHYFTTGESDVCASSGGACDPSTYVMEPGTMDISIAPVEDESGCAESGRPTWDGRTEAHAPEIRKATYRLTWSVCYPDSSDAIVIGADLRVGDIASRDALLEELRAFIDTVSLLEGPLSGK